MEWINICRISTKKKNSNSQNGILELEKIQKDSWFQLWCVKELESCYFYPYKIKKPDKLKFNGRQSKEGQT